MRVLAHPPSRRAFLVLWGGWTAVALLAAALYEMFHESGLAAAVVMVIAACSVAAVLERNFRLKNLPPEARRLWHTLVVLPQLSVPVLVLVAGDKFGHYLPGSEVRRDRCQIVVKRQDATEQDLNFLFTYEWSKSNWGPTMLRGKFSETRVWIKGQNENAWILDEQLEEARSATDNGESVVLNAAGYERMVRSLVGEGVSSDQVTRSANALRDELSRHRTGPSVTVVLGASLMIDRDSDFISRDSRALFFWIAAAVFSLLLIPVTAVVVGATMYPE